MTKATATPWALKWLDAVASGEATMSQRKLASVEERGGGLEAVMRAAKARAVHIVMLTDDKGDVLLAASTKPFKVIC